MSSDTSICEIENLVEANVWLKNRAKDDPIPDHISQAVQAKTSYKVSRKPPQTSKRVNLSLPPLSPRGSETKPRLKTMETENQTKDDTPEIAPLKLDMAHNISMENPLEDTKHDRTLDLSPEVEHHHEDIEI